MRKPTKFFMIPEKVSLYLKRVKLELMGFEEGEWISKMKILVF